MKATNIPSFNLESSLKRIDAILNADNNQFEEANSIPNRDKLTYTNGFYVNCAALFVDIRESSTMTDEHRRPVLAKVYRSFISDIDELFSMAARACSMVDILNYKLKKKGFTTYSVGVGMDYGRALMIKAGCDGSGINDVIWMGDVVNQACHLCNDANSGYFDKRVFLSNVVYNNLNEDNQKLCSKDVGRDIYQANIVNITMNNWLKEQK